MASESTNGNLQHAFQRCNHDDAMPCHTATNHQPGTKNIGRVTQVIGSTFDVEFPEDQLPAIYNAVKIASRAEGHHART